MLTPYSLSGYTGVAICGLAGDGKDTLADLLVAEYGFQKDSMAADLKRIAKDIGWDGNKDAAGRRLLQHLGTEVGRAYNENIWINKIAPRIYNSPAPVVIPDVRFINELEFLRHAGFLTVRVVRGDLLQQLRRKLRRSSWHRSEREWRSWEFDVVIPNVGSVEAFHARARKLLLPYLGAGNAT